MPITIKEIRVVTTVTRTTAADQTPPKEWVYELKREILDELKRTEKRNRRKNHER